MPRRPIGWPCMHAIVGTSLKRPCRAPLGATLLGAAPLARTVCASCTATWGRPACWLRSALRRLHSAVAPHLRRRRRRGRPCRGPNPTRPKQLRWLAAAISSRGTRGFIFSFPPFQKWVATYRGCATCRHPRPRPVLTRTPALPRPGLPGPIPADDTGGTCAQECGTGYYCTQPVQARPHMHPCTPQL